MQIRLSVKDWRNIEKIWIETVKLGRKNLFKKEEDFFEYLSQQWIDIEPINPLKE